PACPGRSAPGAAGGRLALRAPASGPPRTGSLRPPAAFACRLAPALFRQPASCRTMLVPAAPVGAALLAARLPRPEAENPSGRPGPCAGLAERARGGPLDWACPPAPGAGAFPPDGGRHPSAVKRVAAASRRRRRLRSRLLSPLVQLAGRSN